MKFFVRFHGVINLDNLGNPFDKNFLILTTSKKYIIFNISHEGYIPLEGGRESGFFYVIIQPIS